MSKSGRKISQAHMAALVASRVKPVITPRGRFESAAEAAKVFGYDRTWAARLAREGWQGWSYEPREPIRKPVITPRGRFESIEEAAEAFYYNRDHVAHLARHELRGWAYDRARLNPED